jgi:hypothetical protein
MTTIRTTCPRCGEVDMGPGDILLSVGHGGDDGTYRFTCPDCFNTVEKRADRKIIALLVSAGVDIETRAGHELEGTRPLFDQGPDPRDTLPGGPPLTLDDLIDFHFLLQDERVFETLFAERH